MAPNILNLNVYQLIRYIFVVSLVVLIVSSTYFLVTSVQVLQKLYDHLDRARGSERTFVSTPLTANAQHNMDRHEKPVVLIIVISSVTTVVSLIGLTAAVREHILAILVYGVLLVLVFVTSILVVPMKPWLVVLMAFVAILAFSSAYSVRREKRNITMEVSLPDVYFRSDNHLKEKERKHYQFKD